MHRELLYSLVPCAVAIVAAMIALWLLARCSGARLNLARLRRLHECETGGVQSLSFVLTLPFFIMVVLFIVQVSQLMVGVMVVNYAAFAAARAAAVWIPAEVYARASEPANVIAVSGLPDTAVQRDGNTLRLYPEAIDPQSAKYEKIRAAAVMACAPISPSRDLQTGGTALSPWVSRAQQASIAVYAGLSPASQSNSRIPARIRNKIAYSDQNTEVIVEWMEVPHPGKDVEVSPTYNPRQHTNPNIARWQANEVGWQDPITIRVVHDFALLPGPGRFIAKRLVSAAGTPDNVSSRIRQNPHQYREPVFTTRITATSTLTNEGFKSVMPYVF